MHHPWKSNSISNFHFGTTNIRRGFSFSTNLIKKNNSSWPYQILDPNGSIISLWNRIFLAFCLSALFVDPLFFYLPYIAGPACMEVEMGLFAIVCVLRTIADLTYLMHIVFKFRTAFVLPGSRVIGRGELVMEPKEIAIHYLKSDFIIDFAAMLPLPQIMNLFIIPYSSSRGSAHSNNALSLIVLIQYVPRLFLIFPLNRRIVKNTGVVTKTAWAGAAYNLLLYMLASHVLGASWYLMAIQRQHDCWTSVCNVTLNGIPCDLNFLDCKSTKDTNREYWLRHSGVLDVCDPTNETIVFKYGIYADALTSDTVSVPFKQKYLYCLWWGLKNLSSYGQGLATSRYIPETAFCVLICIGGLVLFCHLIGNIQTYLQSMTVRLEEWRVKKRDTEEWMRHRQLPEILQERVRRFVQYKWLATRGVDEDEILRSLPLDLRRDIQSHLCLDLLRRVPLFAQMDSQLLDAICERLVSSLSTEGAFVAREGDPVDEMLFIIRGQLVSDTTDGGRSGFYNSITLRPGDFCGEELLTWALMPNPSHNLPTSTRTVKAICEVEAFALRAEDLKYVANQFKRLHSKRLQHAFRYYSHQWRMWAECYIAAAWRRYKKRKLAEELMRRESYRYTQEQEEDEDEDDAAEYMHTGTDTSRDTGGNTGVGVESSTSDNTSSGQNFGATMLASKFAANTRKKKVKLIVPGDTGIEMRKLLKPDDPYCSGAPDDI
ncbi:hypothetical protein ACHQM5_019654 [Ranunculus cassubicifolius]